jgi:hypothetical protein
MDERFPIVKTISFSSLSNFHHCPKYYELVNVKKFKTKGTPATAFGTLLHKHIQEVLNNEHLIPASSLKFKRVWERFCRLYQITDKYKDLFPVAEKVLYYVNGFFKKEFGTFKIKHIEYKIKNKIANFPQDFKGYIDLVIELENGELVISDIKTTGSAFMFNKYKDNFKEYQLSLYKRFYSEIENIDRDKIRTLFIVIEKDLESKKPLVVVDVTSGDKKLANAESWLLNSLQAINSNKFIKNRMSCNKFGKDYPCIFYRSEHCS